MCQVASSGAVHQLQVPGHIPRGPEHHSRGHFSHFQSSCQASVAYIYGNCLIKSVKVAYYYGIFFPRCAWLELRVACIYGDYGINKQKRAGASSCRKAGYVEASPPPGD